ncbi:MAG: HD domain-containing phosphohydrolase, partial [Sedimenticola sp.]
VAIADVFDALTSERPYKHAWPVSEAVDWMSGQSGQHFDPDLVARFLTLLPEIETIMDQYAD